MYYKFIKARDLTGCDHAIQERPKGGVLIANDDFVNGIYLSARLKTPHFTTIKSIGALLSAAILYSSLYLKV